MAIHSASKESTILIRKLSGCTAWTTEHRGKQEERLKPGKPDVRTSDTSQVLNAQKSPTSEGSRKDREAEGFLWSQ